MPTYSFKNLTTHEVFDKLMKYSDKQPFLQDNPNLTEVFTGAPALGDTIRMGMRKPDEGFREILAKVNENAKDVGGSAKTVLFDR